MNKTEFFVFGLNTLPTNPANIKAGGLYFIQMDNSDLYELWFRNKSNTHWLQLGNVNKGEFLKTFNGLTGELILGASLNVDNDLEITISNSSLTETILVDLSDFATKDWVGLEGFLKATDLNGYATEQWVQNQNYLTQDTKDDIAKGVLAEGWGNHADEDYATETWVSSQGFLTQHQSLAGYATEQWVQSQNYLTQHQDLSGYATESWVNSQNFSTQTLDNIEDITEGVKVTGQVQANALIGMATNSNAAGTYTIDFNNLSENYNLVLTGDTAIDFSNMIAEDETAVFTAVVEGDFNFSVTGLDLDLDGDAYDPSGRNLIVIHIEKGGANYRGTYTIKNI